MNIEQAVIENLRKLTSEKQSEVLDFAKSLTPKTALPSPSPHLTPNEKAEDWRKFLENQPKDTPGLPDEALHRDTMYED